MAKYNPFDNFVAVMDKAAGVMGISEEDYLTFKYPERELKVALPVRMDDGSLKVSKVSAYSTARSADLRKAASDIIRTSTSTKCALFPRG